MELTTFSLQIFALNEWLIKYLSIWRPFLNKLFAPASAFSISFDSSNVPSCTITEAALLALLNYASFIQLLLVCLSDILHIMQWSLNIIQEKRKIGVWMRDVDMNAILPRVMFEEVHCEGHKHSSPFTYRNQLIQLNNSISNLL